MSESEFEGEDVMDSYEEYAEWLTKQPDLRIGNGDALLRHLEAATRFEEFLREIK